MQNVEFSHCASFHRYDIVHNTMMTAPTVNLQFDIVVLDRIAVKKIIHENTLIHHKLSDSLQTKMGSVR